MILSFPPATDFSTLNLAYGTDLPLATLDPSDGATKTIIGYQDVAGNPALRSGIIGQTAIPITLTDGRLALCGTFSQPLLDAITAGTVTATILTDAQFASLIPTMPTP